MGGVVSCEVMLKISAWSNQPTTNLQVWLWGDPERETQTSKSSRRNRTSYRVQCQSQREWSLAALSEPHPATPAWVSRCLEACSETHQKAGGSLSAQSLNGTLWGLLLQVTPLQP